MKLIIICQSAQLATTTVLKGWKLCLQKKNFNIVHTNINGLESKFDNLQELVSTVSSWLIS